MNHPHLRLRPARPLSPPHGTPGLATRPLATAKVMAMALSLGLASLFGAGAAWAAAEGSDFFHAGSFRRMMHTGDTAGSVGLDRLPRGPGTWGVGATAGLKGEIVQIDGRVLVSPGHDAQGRVQAPSPGEQALLFASARVASWADIVLPTDMDAAQLEVFVREQAVSRGRSADAPFAFRVEGRFPRLRWHVVTGEASAGGHGGAHQGAAAAEGHANARAGLRIFHSPGATGQLIGIYSGAALEGVVSHPGERLHVHYVDAAVTVSGHVDAYAVAAGSVLKLPQP